MALGIGKLIGKVVGEVVAAPWTIGAEILDAAEETIEQAEKAVDRAIEDKE